MGQASTHELSITCQHPSEHAFSYRTIYQKEYEKN